MTVGHGYNIVRYDTVPIRGHAEHDKLLSRIVHIPRRAWYTKDINHREAGGYETKEDFEYCPRCGQRF